jgi:acyl-CoA synthetase (AMP-forming)/AMP-acid ligase II
MTECPRLTQASFEEIAARPGTVGRTVPLRHARVVEVGTDTAVAPGHEGEVLVGGPDLYHGYLGQEPVGAWHRTGDLGRLDEDGYLYITGRASSVVKVGGNRVSTEEVAAALRAHPAVAQAAVIAVDDARFTTRLEAFAVLRDDAGAIAPDAITAWLSERLTSYQVPRGLTLLDELPVDSSGKLSLSTLRAMVAR